MKTTDENSIKNIINKSSAMIYTSKHDSFLGTISVTGSYLDIFHPDEPKDLYNRYRFDMFDYTISYENGKVYIKSKHCDVPTTIELLFSASMDDVNEENLSEDPLFVEHSWDALIDFMEDNNSKVFAYDTYKDLSVIVEDHKPITPNDYSYRRLMLHDTELYWGEYVVTVSKVMYRAELGMYVLNATTEYHSSQINLVIEL